MAQIIYDGNLLAPSSFISVEKTYNNQGGRVVGSKYNIVLTCRIFAEKGSPLTTGWHTGGGTPATESFTTDDAKFKSICKKLEIVNELFKVGNEGKVLQWQDSTTGVATKCNPRIVSVSIPDSSSFHRWVTVADYSITFEADDLLRSGSGESFSVDGNALEYIESLSESFSLEEQKEGDVTTYALTRSVQATGRRHYISDGTVPKEAWERAKDAALLRLANLNRYSSFYSANLASMTGYEDTKNESIDEANGTYSITQVKVFANQAYVQTLEISTATGSGNNAVSVSGSIRGLGDDVATRLSNAVAGFSVSTLHGLAQTHSGISTLNPDPLTQTVGKSIYSGTVSFSLEFNDRPTSLIPGSLTENIEIQQTSPGQKIAQIFVLGRPTPVLQDLSAGEARTKTASVSALMPRSSTINFTSAPSMASLLTLLTPTGVAVYEQPATETWNPLTGEFSWSISWVYEV
jgi:hypothetical protein